MSNRDHIFLRIKAVYVSILRSKRRGKQVQCHTKVAPTIKMLGLILIRKKDGIPGRILGNRIKIVQI